ALFFFSSRRRHTSFSRDWSSDVCSSDLESALLNNVLGLTPGTLGKEILEQGARQLADTYPGVVQIHKEKVTEVRKEAAGFTVIKIGRASCREERRARWPPREQQHRGNTR